jgi:uncharacterized protein (TIGR02301 family)
MNQKRLHVLLLCLVCLAGTSAAQSGLPARGPDYFRDATDLAATLGAAHAIRVLCNGRDDQYWRRYMAEMLNYEAPESGPLRSGLVQAFNNAYTQTARVHNACDPGAIQAEARFASDGHDIAVRLASHYFPRDPRRGGRN